MKRLSRALAVVAVTMCGALWLALPAGAQTVAQAWPPKTIRIIIPFPPGGTTDLIARRAQPMLERNLKVSILIENRGGASGAIGTQAAVASAPDGATFVLVFDTHGANPSLLPNLPFDTHEGSRAGHADRHFADGHHHASVDRIQELCRRDDCSAKSGSVAYGTIGAGSLAHLAMSQIGNALDVTMTHVPYKGGGPLVNDAIAGHVPVAIASIALLSPHIKSGALRPLAATSPKRIAQLPDTPTVGEAGVPGFDAVSWWGLLAPAKTPPEIIARMNAAIAEALNDPTVKQNLSEQGVDYRLSSPDEFGRFVEAEIKRWAKVVKDNNIVVKD